MVFLPFLALAFLGGAQSPAPSHANSRPDSRLAENVPTAKPLEARQPVSAEMRGDIFMARKMYREAIEAYRQGPPSAVLINKTGIAYHQLLDFKTAKKYYERAIKLNPKYSEAVNNLGTIYYATKSYRRAIKQYKKALRLSPDSASIYSNLGTGYFARHNYKAAADAYQHALALDPEVFEQRSATGVLLQERNVAERAKFHYYLAKTYAKAGMNDRSLLYIRKALEEGFKERQKFLEEPEFAGLQKLPEFQQLMALEPRIL
ncbi:MAG TPA: tetratricopeptide repeat protein [Bryobacteraceae bacterium]|nr:tetratricopeptide repeat protein [Bryobacteraceae bacterium]